MPKVKYRAHAHSENKTKTVVKIKNFNIIVDEPKIFGGTNEGPNPLEILLAAFAGCLNIVGHKVAKDMGFSLNSIKIDIEGDIDPSKFMGLKTRKRAGYTEIRVKITPDTITTVDPETLAKWVEEIEERCPVSDVLSNGTKTKIEVV
ncbi:MAG: OsmC family protein [Clostridiales bacterium]|nr:OsmC family protein [Clostridiales bacterium]